MSYNKSIYLGNFPIYLGNFPVSPEIFPFLRKFSELFGNFLSYSHIVSLRNQGYSFVLHLHGQPDVALSFPLSPSLGASTIQ